MNGILPPVPLSNEGNMAENWRKWKHEFIVFMELSNSIGKPQEIQASFLRYYIGEVGKNIIQKLVFENESDRNNIFKLMEKLDEHFTPVNEVIVRYRFFTTERKKNQSIEDYINHLKNLAENCNFGRLKDSLIRDKVVADIKDSTLRAKLFDAQNLNLPKLILIYKDHAKRKQSSEKTDLKETERNCWRCNQRHLRRQCPAWNSKCENCGENHHFTNCCKKNNFSKSKQHEINKHNPQRNENNYNKGNMQNINTGNTEVPSNMNPSAPPGPYAGNRIYPNLNIHNRHEELFYQRQRETLRTNEMKKASNSVQSAREKHTDIGSKVKDTCVLS